MLIAAAVAAAGTLAALYAALWTLGFGYGFWTAPDAEHRRSYRTGIRVRRGWKTLADRLNLSQRDRPRPARQGHPNRPPKLRIPKLRKITADTYGITAHITLTPPIRVEDFAAHAPDLANAWGMVRVDAEQTEPNKIQVRAVRRDPLRVRTEFAPAPVDLRHYAAGFDSFGRRARIRLHHGSGLCVYGLPTYGKTSFIMGLIAALAPSESVQFLIADGKTLLGHEGDYADIAPRALSVIGDDPSTFNTWIRQINTIRAMRASTIRQALGVRNFWDAGPSPEWPLIVPVVDECHTFFEQVTAHGNAVLTDRNGLAADNAHQVSELVRKCQAAGILPILATQKGTADAIPSQISANCHASVCFAVKTDEAAAAALGPGINRFPEYSPVRYQAEDYIGVATMAADHRAGFVQFRSPYCPESLAAAIAESTAALALPQTCPGLTIGTEHRATLAAADQVMLLGGVDLGKSADE
ncbi:hypothetical protein ACWDUL_23180 [Nocardia niigatensis]